VIARGQTWIEELGVLASEPVLFCRAESVCWHFSDLSGQADQVRSRGKSGPRNYGRRVRLPLRQKALGISRFDMKYSAGGLSHERILRCIRLYSEKSFLLRVKCLLPTAIADAENVITQAVAWSGTRPK
jgi:hypothetical protein